MDYWIWLNNLEVYKNNNGAYPENSGSRTN